ncbi:MAG: biotin synthase BioB [Desulfurella sp.]|uniref:biotin synthase BioB n=1 Tax=Desulfurella TaxID=33001 RepID=UPI000CB0EDF7|nr:biotin synthase BioB [Desulfurella multipotens]PMP64747.1 MAG: biotin synthase BioB [Desulfurella multipotens]
MHLDKLFDKALEKNIDFNNAMDILKTPQNAMLDLFSVSNKLRQFFKGNTISLCSIVNAKSGRCSENCAFCAQSAHFNTNIESYDFLPPSTIEQKAKYIANYPVERFSIVTSGLSLNNKQDFENLKISINKISKLALIPGVSIGLQTKNQLLELKKAGLLEFHHNLETSREFFPKICTTHSYDDDVNTVKVAKQLGFYVCSGGIFGIGESLEDRISLAFELKNLDVDSIPINFLISIKGTPLENQKPLEPFEALKIISMFRFIMPDKDIRVCGGREHVLKQLHALVFFAGANGIMVSDYLTQKGRSIQDDLDMIKNLGLNVNPQRF